MERQAGALARIRFGAFELDLRSRELRSGGRRIRLQEQPFEILRTMLERPGEVVTRDELRERLWRDGTTVDFEHSLNAAVKRLRSALGDDAGQPVFIETLPRRGYRFIAKAEAAASPGTAGGPPKRPLPLVVLPFSNLSDDSAQEYFSDGLTEELIAQLGPMLRGHVGVIARWSSMAFKGSLQRAREIGDMLHADCILEGSVRRDGPRVRITARLIDAASEVHIWSDTFERTVNDWLSVQAEVGGRVARSLVKELVIRPRRSDADAPPQAAHQAYLKGRYHWARPGDVGLDDAMAYFEGAVAQAPQFAAAYSALSRVKVASAEYYRTLPRTALAEARDAALKALALDPSLAEAHATMGDVRRIVDRDWHAADAAYTEAMATNPSNEIAPRGYGLMLASLGRTAEAIEHVERACEIDPLCLIANTAAAWVRYAAGDYDAAAARCRHTLDMDEDFAPALRLLGAALLECGYREEALAVLERAVAVSRNHPVALAWLAYGKACAGDDAGARAALASIRRTEARGYVPPYHLALALAALGDIDKAFESLEQALLDRDPMAVNLAVDPRLESLRSDPRFDVLVAALNLPRDSVVV